MALLSSHLLRRPIPPAELAAVVADGDKDSVLTAEVLSAAYETPIRVAKFDGYFFAYPGTGTENVT